LHVAIIMDGNGRWAEQRGLPRTAGHRAGARAVRRIVEAAARGPVEVLTLYAFSADNWSRPAGEVRSLMQLLKRHLISEAARCTANGVRIKVIGRRDRLDPDLLRTMEQAERLTAAGTRLELRLAVDYSARETLLRAAYAAAAEPGTRGAGTPHGGVMAEFEARVAAAMHAQCTRPVDLLIRTGGEQRLSDFLLWECAYAELVFVERYWPDFDEAAFDAALREFAHRDRRYGGLRNTAAATVAAQGSAPALPFGGAS
jgi:undecaprenyl diphosphate synthase